MAYSQAGDLLNGNIPLPSYISADKVVEDAADEIDSQIGFIYKTPINVADSSPVSRPARLLLKRINNFLATGRLLLSVDAGEERDRVHAYGLSLIKEAKAALAAIVAGTIELDGAEVLAPGSEHKASERIVIDNIDPESNVEAFYDRVLMPGVVTGLAEPFPPPSRGFVR